MKKILLATTALVISGAAASANVSPAISIGGQGRLGVVHIRTAAAANLNALNSASSAANAAAAAANTAAANASAAAAAAAANQAAAQSAFNANPNAVTGAALNAATAAASAAAANSAAAATNAANANAAAAAAAAAALAGQSSSVTALEHRLRLNVTVNVQADHGVSFGGFVRYQAGDGTGGRYGGAWSGSRVWVEASGLRLTFGNQDGAIASYGYAGAQFVGYTGGTFNSGAGLITASGMHQFSSGGLGLAQIAHLQYSSGDYTVGVSHQRGGHTEVAGMATFDAITVALGFANGVGSSRIATASVAYNGGSWGASANVARLGQGVGSVTNYTVNGFADVSGGRVHGYIGRINRVNIWGVGYRYNLGGGATLAAGIERDFALGGRNTRAEVGAVFNF